MNEEKKKNTQKLLLKMKQINDAQCFSTFYYGFFLFDDD